MRNKEVLATLMDGKMTLQKVAFGKYQEKIFEELKELEEQKTREALELVRASCHAPLVNHEGPFSGATIDAVRQPSDTGR